MRRGRRGRRGGGSDGEATPPATDAAGLAPDGAPDPAGDFGLPADAAEAFTLTVEGGYGSGAYPPGARVHVWATVDPLSEGVTGWTGDVDLLERPAEWHTVLTMPARAVAVAAQVAPRPEVLVQLRFPGSTGHEKIVRYLPIAGGQEPVGVVLLLHGTGGSSEIIEKAEGRALALAAVARGHAVVAPEAEEAAQGDLDGDDKVRWDTRLRPTNVDLMNLNQLVDTLRTEEIMDPGTPVFLVGMSNGGAASFSYSAVAASPLVESFPNLRFAAVVSYCASGHGVADLTTTPTAWFLCGEDDNPEVSNEEAQANSAALAARGVDTLVDLHPASPLPPERFTRVEGIDVTTSRAMVEELRAKGYLGPDDHLITPTDDIAAAVGADPESFPVLSALRPAQLLDVRDQLRVTRAEHALYSDWAMRTVDFLDAHRP